MIDQRGREEVWPYLEIFVTFDCVMEKNELRRTVRACAERYDAGEREDISRRILERVERMPEFQSAERIALYWSLPNEVATHRFVERWSGSKRIYLPVMQGEGLLLRRFIGSSRLQEARFGVFEPEEGETIPLSEVDLIVVPAVGYDRMGNRLGHGKGFYDRLLRGEGDTLKIGICFDYQLFDAIPVAEFDVPVDRVVCGSKTQINVWRRGIPDLDSDSYR